MIYQKMIGMKIDNANESAALSLMGTDVERIVETWYLLIAEIWANMVQIGIAVWLLERQLGAVCVAPIIVALGMSRSVPSFYFKMTETLTFLAATATSMKAATFVTSRQKIWLEAIQDRINFTSEILGSMANVKMLGLTDKMTTIIQSMRVKELNLSKRFRRLSSFNVCLGNLIDP